LSRKWQINTQAYPQAKGIKIPVLFLKIFAIHPCDSLSRVVEGRCGFTLASCFCGTNRPD
ncbi:MAG: hypothetical protein ACPG70_01255, partial [Candidatus Puniceispirillaceae bacterium]